MWPSAISKWTKIRLLSGSQTSSLDLNGMSRKAREKKTEERERDGSQSEMEQEEWKTRKVTQPCLLLLCDWLR